MVIASSTGAAACPSSSCPWSMTPVTWVNAKTKTKSNSNSKLLTRRPSTAAVALTRRLAMRQPSCGGDQLDVCTTGRQFTHPVEIGPPFALRQNRPRGGQVDHECLRRHLLEQID